MTTFEEVGRKIDHELERLRQVAESKVSPATRRKAAQSLRSVSEALAKAAADLESKLGPKPE